MHDGVAQNLAHLMLRLEVDHAGNVSLMVLPQNEESGDGLHEFRGAPFEYREKPTRK